MPESSSSPATIQERLNSSARCRTCPRRGGADALSRHASHDWAGDREWLYYDFYRAEPFTPEDFPAIEKKMAEIIARDKPFTKEIWTREEAKSWFETHGEAFKVELVDAIPGTRI